MNRRTRLAMLLLLPWPLLGGAEPASPPAQRAVLVTGASTGIGRKVTERLAADGYFVFAGARKPEDLKALGALKNVQAVRLDVTRQEEIDAAADLIGKSGRGLYGLVNNAGIGTVGSVADMKPEEFDLLMAVNLYGPYRVTRAVEPLILAAKGRVINIGSISGIGFSPNLMAYSMSKHALEAFSDSLFLQLKDSGATSSIVEPGNYNSDIARNAIQRLGADAKVLRDPGYHLSADRSRYKQPDEVADAVEKALFEPEPKRRYLVTPNQDEAEWAVTSLIGQLVQLNEGQRYTYSRDQLVKMLDDALAHSRPRTSEP
jgi:NAD(P)-dependent dehydrogenase (short-subunit alcohol dehydrogenase family)